MKGRLHLSERDIVEMIREHVAKSEISDNIKVTLLVDPDITKRNPAYTISAMVDLQ